MNLENIILSERSESKKLNVILIPYEKSRIGKSTETEIGLMIPSRAEKVRTDC